MSNLKDTLITPETKLQLAKARLEALKKKKAERDASPFRALFTSRPDLQALGYRVLPGSDTGSGSFDPRSILRSKPLAACVVILGMLLAGIVFWATVDIDVGALWASGDDFDDDFDDEFLGVQVQPAFVGQGTLQPGPVLGLPGAGGHAAPGLALPGGAAAQGLITSGDFTTGRVGGGGGGAASEPSAGGAPAKSSKKKDKRDKKDKHRRDRGEKDQAPGLSGWLKDMLRTKSGRDEASMSPEELQEELERKMQMELAKEREKLERQIREDRRRQERADRERRQRERKDRERQRRVRDRERREKERHERDSRHHHTSSRAAAPADGENVVVININQYG